MALSEFLNAQTQKNRSGFGLSDLMGMLKTGAELVAAPFTGGATLPAAVGDIINGASRIAGAGNSGLGDFAQKGAQVAVNKFKSWLSEQSTVTTPGGFGAMPWMGK